MMKKLLIGAGLLLSLTTVSNAESLIFKGTGQLGSYGVSLNGKTRTVGAGTMKFVDGSGSDLWLLCTEITQSVGNYGVKNEYSVSQQTGSVGYLAQKYADLQASGQLDAAKAAGLQLAIWEVTYDGAGNSSDLYKGNFKVKSTNNNLADQGLYWAKKYMDELQGNTAAYTAYKNGKYQDYIGANPVPEPATMLALLAGGGMILRRRQKNKNAA